MRTSKILERLMLLLFATVLLGQRSNAAEGGLIFETGGVQIALASGWELLQQPATFFVQKRARNAERGIALSAGSISLDLPFQQYVALGAAGLMAGTTEAQLDDLAKRLDVPRPEVDKALASEIGKQTLARLKQSSRSMRFELVDVASQGFWRHTI